MSTPLLIDLARAAPEISAVSLPASLAIRGITADSRQVKPGYVFVALKGTKVDATPFIADAARAGAAAIVCDTDIPADVSVPVLRSVNVRKTLAHMAAAFYTQQPDHIVAITGTDGKTSTADFYRQFWYHLGASSSSIGTLGVIEGGGNVLYPEMQTTPNPIDLHRILSEMAEKKVTHVAMEASSHGLDQYRLDGVKLEAAAFTNIARDHLDYHKTEEAYFAAKARLFSDVLPSGKTAVINQDDAKFPRLVALCDRRGIRVVGFGKKGEQYRLLGIKPRAQGQTVTLEIHGTTHTLDIPLAGAFQAFNIAAALALVEATGGALDKAIAVIPKLKGVPGRLERVATLANGAAVYIDYAHTPMALANILKTLRPHTQNTLHVVFGCGGDRDAGKRPEMGRAANALADVITVTDDNPRSEDPALIRKAVLTACPRGKEVADRKQAIYDALSALTGGDVLVVAGKGHEKTQIIGNRTFPFDDAEIVRQGVNDLRLAA